MSTALSQWAFLRHRSSRCLLRRASLRSSPSRKAPFSSGSKKNTPAWAREQGCWTFASAWHPTSSSSGPTVAWSASSQHRGFVSGTTPRCEKRTIPVPTMGDSITEGSIVEWTVQVGQAVQPDDVVALIETDKVTVEIKATTSGVITQQFGAVEDTVEVGAKLYEIDTEGEATVVAGTHASSGSAPIPESNVVATEEAVVEPLAAAQDPLPQHQGRIPSIHFLQKDGWAKRKKAGGDHATPPVADVPPPPRTSPLGVTSYTVDAVHPMYGRPKFTDAEIEALMYGGANLVA